MQNNKNTYLNPSKSIVNPFSGNSGFIPLIKSQDGDEVLYEDHDEEYDYKMVDGQWMSKKKTEPDAEWKSFENLSPEDRELAETSLNEKYPDAGFGIVEEDKDPNKDLRKIAKDSNLDLNETNLKFISPDSGTINSGIGETGILDVVKALDTTYNDFKSENYYDPGSKADYAKFSHTNTTDEGLYVDEEALMDGKKTGDVLGSKKQIHESSMQRFLDQRHDRNPDKYAKVNDFESDIYNQTGYLNYKDGPLEGDNLENEYSDATDIGWNLDRDGNYDKSFDYLTANEDGETFDQQSFEVGSDEYNTSIKHNPQYNFSNTKFTPNINTNMNLEDEDPYAYIKKQQQRYGGSPHLQYEGDLYRAQGGFDFKGWMKGEQGFIPDYDGQSTRQTINENETVNNVLDYTQTGLGVVGLQDYSGPIAAGADLGNSALSSIRAAIAPKGSEQRKMHTENAVLNATSAIPGYGLATGIASLTKDAANYSGVLDSNTSFGTQTGEFARNVIDNNVSPSFSKPDPILNIAENTNDTPDAKNLAIGDTVEVDDEQTLGAWGLETPRRLKKMQYAGSSSGYNPLTNQSDPLNLGSNPFNSEMLDSGAADFTAPDLTPYFDTADQMYAMNQSVQRSMDSFDAFKTDMNARLENPQMVQTNTKPLATLDPGLLNSVQRLTDMSYSRDARQDNRVMEDGTIIKTPEEMQEGSDAAIAALQDQVSSDYEYTGSKRKLRQAGRDVKRGRNLGFENDSESTVLTKLEEYDKNESLENLQNEIREDKLNKDNKDSNPSFGDKVWNAKNKFLDSKVGQTYGKIGAGISRIAKPVNRILEMREEREQKRNMKNAYMSDNLFATRESDISGSKGDYGPNSGIFRPDDKVTGTRQGKYGTELTNTLYKAQSGFWDGVKNTALSMAENLTPIGQTYQLANYAKDIYDGESLSNVGNNILDDTQTKLGYAGNIIGPGDIADGVNSLISTGRGYFSNDADTQAQHYKNAAISAESIINPVLGAASTLDNASDGVTSLTDYAGVTPNIANYAINQGADTQSSSPTFADNDQPGSSSRGDFLKRGGSFFNDGGEAEIDINMYKELIAAGADLEII